MAISAIEKAIQAALGKERNANFTNRISFTQASLEDRQQLTTVAGTFDAVISARALHHFTENQRRRHIFQEAYSIIRPGGCFINADNARAPITRLRERYARARDGWLDRQVRERSGGKTNLKDVKAATPSTYHGPHNNCRLDEELAWLQEAGFEDMDCFWKSGATVVYGGFRPE